MRIETYPNGGGEVLHMWYDEIKDMNEADQVELVSKELNHLVAILHVYAGGFEFYEVKKKIFVIIFQKENGNTFTLFIIFVVKSLQKKQNSTNLQLWPPISRNKSVITPKWFNSLDTNSTFLPQFTQMLLC